MDNTIPFFSLVLENRTLQKPSYTQTNLKRLLLFLIWFGTIVRPVQAQTIDPSEVEKRMDTLFNFLNHPQSAGAAVTVIHQGNVIARKNYGMANLEHAVPFTHQSPVRMVYSMGREFMSVGLAIMEMEGIVKFEDKVKDYFPKLPEWSKDVTIQDLLNHSSGFDDEWSLLLLMTADMRSQVETEQVLTLLYNQPSPQVEPGKGYMYNNTDFGLLRLIMEKASGENLSNFLQRKLFQPLGMNTTLMNDDIEALIPGLSENYYGYNPLRKARFLKFSPGGDYRIVTSAADLEKWALAIEDPSSLVSQAYARLYKEARPIPVIAPERHYTFGHEWRTVEGTEVIYYGGVGDSFYLIRIPSKQLSIIGLGNAGNFINPTMQLAEDFLPQPKASHSDTRYFPAERVSLSQSEMENLTGRYFSQQIGFNSAIPSIRFYDLKLEGESFKLYPDSNGQPIEITPFGNGYFKDLVENVKIQFSKSHPDSAMKMEAWFNDTLKPLKFLREEGKMEPEENYLRQFTGQYHSPHLDYYLRIVLHEDGQLIVRRPTVPEVKLETSTENKFIMEQQNGSYSVYVMLTFTKNSKSEVDGITLQDSRMMHHRFEKVDQ